MKLKEIRLYKVKVIENDNVLFDDIAEKLPEELKEKDIIKIDLDDGEAIVHI